MLWLCSNAASGETSCISLRYNCLCVSIWPSAGDYCSFWQSLGGNVSKPQIPSLTAWLFSLCCVCVGGLQWYKIRQLYQPSSVSALLEAADTQHPFLTNWLKYTNTTNCAQFRSSGGFVFDVQGSVRWNESYLSVSSICPESQKNKKGVWTTFSILLGLWTTEGTTSF